MKQYNHLKQSCDVCSSFLYNWTMNQHLFSFYEWINSISSVNFAFRVTTMTKIRKKTNKLKDNIVSVKILKCKWSWFNLIWTHVHRWNKHVVWTEISELLNHSLKSVIVVNFTCIYLIEHRKKKKLCNQNVSLKLN